MKRQVFIVGEPNEQDFGRVNEWFASRSSVSVSSSVSEACVNLANCMPPEVIVFLQSRPGQFSASDIEQIHRYWPLARLIMVLGSWCEGEARSGKPSPGVWRIYWYDVARRLGPIFDRQFSQLPQSWNLPRTAGEGERLLADLNGIVPCRSGVVLIASYSIDAYEVLADACRTLGLDAQRCTSSDVRPATPFTAGIWDSRQGDDGEWSQIRSFARSIEPSPVVVMQGFPRATHCDQALSNGWSVLAKPFQLPDLWRALGATGTIDQLSSCSSSLDGLR